MEKKVEFIELQLLQKLTKMHLIFIAIIWQRKKETLKQIM